MGSRLYLVLSAPARADPPVIILRRAVCLSMACPSLLSSRFFFGLRDRPGGEKILGNHSNLNPQARKLTTGALLGERVSPLDWFRADAAQRLPLYLASARPKWLPRVPKLLSKMAQPQRCIVCNNFDHTGGTRPSAESPRPAPAHSHARLGDEGSGRGGNRKSKNY